MAANLKQKIILLNIVSETQELIEAKLLEGYQIMHIINLQPKYDKLLIVYTLVPEEPE